MIHKKRHGDAMLEQHNKSTVPLSNIGKIKHSQLSKHGARWGQAERAAVRETLQKSQQWAISLIRKIVEA